MATKGRKKAKRKTENENYTTLFPVYAVYLQNGRKKAKRKTENENYTTKFPVYVVYLHN